jgi:hypothetical protein
VVRQIRIEISYLGRFQERTKVLYTIVHNLEASNYLDIGLDVACRLLLTSTLKSFTIGHTILHLPCMIPSYPLGTSSRTGPKRAYGFGPCRLFPYPRLTVEVDYWYESTPWVGSPLGCGSVLVQPRLEISERQEFARPSVVASRPDLKNSPRRRHAA